MLQSSLWLLTLSSFDTNFHVIASNFSTTRVVAFDRCRGMVNEWNPRGRGCLCNINTLSLVVVLIDIHLLCCTIGRYSAVGYIFSLSYITSDSNSDIFSKNYWIWSQCNLFHIDWVCLWGVTLWEYCLLFEHHQVTFVVFLNVLKGGLNVIASDLWPRCVQKFEADGGRWNKWNVWTWDSDIYAARNTFLEWLSNRDLLEFGWAVVCNSLIDGDILACSPACGYLICASFLDRIWIFSKSA